jgi:hypothetical protein
VGNNSGGICWDPCADCGQVTVVMLGMVPGRDGKPWRLCLRCWQGNGKPRAVAGYDLGTGEVKTASPPTSQPAAPVQKKRAPARTKRTS